MLILSNKRYGLFECFDSIGDCCASYWCAPCYAAYAANVAQENIFSSALQCLCYPLGLCFLRPKIRSDLGIEVNLFKKISRNIYLKLKIYFQRDR